ncbi:hypothetical protein HY631_04645 [Candidatus Uhrbacteria bacterium]|nr:hypothetical protein [Candidatus Uhrbacteria bacterium]
MRPDLAYTKRLVAAFEAAEKHATDIDELKARDLRFSEDDEKFVLSHGVLPHQPFRLRQHPRPDDPLKEDLGRGLHGAVFCTIVVFPARTAGSAVRPGRQRNRKSAPSWALLDVLSLHAASFSSPRSVIASRTEITSPRFTST